MVFPVYSPVINEFPPKDIKEWVTDLGFYIMDVILVPEIYQTVMRLTKWNTRKMTDEEISLAKMIFGNNVRYDLVRVDNNARFATKNIAIAYVSFNTINYRKKIKKNIFIHEMVHIWQYQHFGSIYIARAIKAQRSKEGYDYGGPSHLYDQMVRGKRLTDFNFEQQADIVEDYYALRTHEDNVGAMHMEVYKYFVKYLDR